MNKKHLLWESIFISLVGLSTHYGLFNAKIWIICKWMIITRFSMVPVLVCFSLTALFWLQSFACTHVCGFKYSYLILTIHTQFYGFKYLFLCYDICFHSYMVSSILT